MSNDKPYAAPTITTLGTVAQLTAQQQNKVGQSPDSFTAITGGAVVGSLVPAP